MSRAWLVLVLLTTGCGSSPAATGTVDAGGDASVVTEAGASFLCSYECGPVDASADGSALVCTAGQICGFEGTVPGFRCCTPSDPPGDNCYPGSVPEAGCATQ